MSISELVRRLEDSGHLVTVTPDGRLEVSNASTLTDDDRADIRASKADLVAWLAPLTRFGVQAAEDARLLVGLIDNDPRIELDELRQLSKGLGIRNERFTHAMAALPGRMNQRKVL
jgi:hypothetical protein